MYIGAERRVVDTLKDTAAGANCPVEVEMVKNGKFAIIHLLNNKGVFNLILIDGALEDIQCTYIIDFVLKNKIIDRSQICVVGYHFNKNEVAELSNRDVMYIRTSYDFLDIQRYFTNVIMENI